MDQMKNIDIQSLIWKYSKRNGYDRKKLALVTGMSKSSLDHKCTSPDRFTVGELRLIFDVLKVPQDERCGL